jgi:small subunit ribosomal protein S21
MSYFDKPKFNKVTGNAVIVQNDNVEKALRKFKKKVLESGLLQELRDREFYTKPTTARKQAKNAAKRRWKKKLADQQLPKKLY